MSTPDPPGRHQRKSLPHEPPPWVDPSEAVYFVTVNCQQRETNILCHADIAATVFDSVVFRNGSGEWFCHLCLLMPDHLHALLSFTNPVKTIQQTISDWKRWLAGSLGIIWQRDFFEHRLRSESEEREKADYILHNPVRRTLVSRSEDWPFVWRPRDDDIPR